MGGEKRIPAKKGNGKKPKHDQTESVIAHPPAVELKKFELDQAGFKQQIDFIRDPARLKALWCTRRAAKSYTGGLYLVEEALKTPNSNFLFIALTRETAKGIIWKDILKDLNIKYDLKMVFNGTTLTATLPNGSEIWVTGADADEDEMNKLLGKKYRLVVIDEASMFSVNMHQLVYGVLKPAVADQRGTICLLGTSSNVTRGLFYDITTGKEAGWSLHKWTAYDNPHVKTQWEEELEEIRTKRPKFMATALFRQWYLNEWVIDENALIYKFLRSRNEIPQLPTFSSPWRNALGIHIGHSPDPSGFVVARYSDESPHLFVVHCEKHLNMDAFGVANKINKLNDTYDFEVSVIYGLSKKSVEELNSRYNCNVIDADTKVSEKEHWINLSNSDLIQGKSLFTTQAEELKQELETLVWQTDNGIVKLPRKEHEGIPNQLANAFLYLWRHTYAYLYSKPDPGPKQEDWEKRHIASMSEQVRRAQNPHHFDEEMSFDEDLFDFSKDDVL